MCRTTYVHHQEDLIAVYAFLHVMFSMHLCKQSRSLEDVLDRAHPPPW